jgi:mycothiol system anti-sigma-R factor
MGCQDARERMGARLDDELSAVAQAELEEHLRSCAGCAEEFEAEQSVVETLHRAAGGDEVNAPPTLWASIAGRLDEAERVRLPARLAGMLHRPMALAASLAIVIGVGVFLAILLSPGADTVEATVVDYSVLLDGLGANAEEAVQRFLGHYGAVEVDPGKAQDTAPTLRFAVPAELPGGYRREHVYRLRFGTSPGVAACYHRGSEPLVVFFHPPMTGTRLGVHRESDCPVAGREGHRIDVGPWRLIHFTDPTTCHCLLSRLDREEDVFAVMGGIAPSFTGYLRSNGENEGR